VEQTKPPRKTIIRFFSNGVLDHEFECAGMEGDIEVYNEFIGGPETE
jgi:hypothetical protein